MFATLLIMAGFLGGMIRGMMGFLSHAKGRVTLPHFLIVIICEGIIGMIFALAVYATGMIYVDNTRGQLIAMAMTAYVGADIINSIYTVLFKKRMEP